YAPVIRGVAQTNALIEIRQNGYIIYTTNVAAGNFVINDLYAANQSGDLEVSIIESDGRIKKFVQPYSAVPNMVRAGQSKFQLTAGQYRDG
ncbi:fimbria/pilus outer membrane usher protein, partial [Acinetobacter baumannii]